MIVGINGVAGSGKDAVGGVCRERWGCKRLAFADRMKEFALAVNPWVPIDPLLVDKLQTRGQIVRLAVMVDAIGWDAAKQNPEVRRLLIAIGTEGGRNCLGEDIWIKQVSPLVRKDKNYVVTDVRFLNEAEWVRNHGGIVVRVERPGYGPLVNHDSEVHGDSLWDTIIHNNGTLEDLETTVVDQLDGYFNAS